MSQQDTGAGSPPLVPPTDAAPLPPFERLTSWPRKLGIVAIIFGALGIAKGLLTLFTTTPALRKLAANDAQRNFLDSPFAQTWQSVNNVYDILVATLGLLLLLCGIALIKRRRWSTRGMLAWALSKVIVEGVSVLASYVMYSKTAEAIRQGLLEYDNVPFTFRIWSTNAIILGLVASCALAVFTLIWFARADIREEIADWR